MGRGYHNVITGEFIAYPKGKRTPGLTAEIERRLNNHFRGLDPNFKARLKGWGEKRGHLLIEITWEITVFRDAYLKETEDPTEKRVQYFIDHFGGLGTTSEIVYDLRPTRRPPIEHPFGGFE
jgi:hypothetical protein